MADCPFCERINAGGALLADQFCAVIRDAFPLNPGHCLIVPRRHVSSFFDMTEAERSDLFALVPQVKALIEESNVPAGYNLGMNIGALAGQTIGHAHLHVIPRYLGDVDDPRGGIRNIISVRARYWECNT
jgi:diadenosine tetraphosphate (Ap4A) HIT family hydrolase